LLVASAAVSRKLPPIHVGCCGFALAQAECYRAFSCLEIDSSFYRLPQPATAARWRAAAPAGFAFALKAWQLVTHDADSPTYARTRLDPGDRDYCGSFRWNATVRWAWGETLTVAKALDAFLILLQCPASFRPNKENVARLRQFAERAPRGRCALGWEPRGAWDAGLIGDLCRELDLVHVVNPLDHLPATPAKLRYFRLHGMTFTNTQLVHLREICGAGRGPVYCLFNNRAMVADARRFQQLVPVSPSGAGPRQ
jgi:uncharacterized protein YecE (DUF72 family)